MHHPGIGIDSVFAGMSDAPTVASIVERPQIGTGLVKREKSVATDIGKAQMSGVAVAE